LNRLSARCLANGASPSRSSLGSSKGVSAEIRYPSTSVFPWPMSNSPFPRAHRVGAEPCGALRHPSRSPTICPRVTGEAQLRSLPRARVRNPPGDLAGPTRTKATQTRAHHALRHSPRRGLALASSSSFPTPIPTTQRREPGPSAGPPLSKTRPDGVPHYLQTPDVCCYVTSILILPAARHPQRNFRVKHPLMPPLSTCVRSWRPVKHQYGAALRPGGDDDQRLRRAPRPCAFHALSQP